MSKPEFQDALKALRNGETILLPHDCGWCFAAEACNEKAVDQVKLLIPNAAEFTALVSDLNMLGNYIKDFPPFAADILEFAEKPTRATIPDAVKLASALLHQNQSAAFRMVQPRNEPGAFCSKLIFQFRKPLACIDIPFERAPSGFAGLPSFARGFAGYIVPWFQTFEYPKAEMKQIQFNANGTFLINS